MKKIIWLLVLFSLTSAAFATVVLNRRVLGFVKTVDQQKQTIVIVPEVGGEFPPKEIVVDASEATLRRDGVRVRLNALTVGQEVLLYFRRERGHTLTTSVSWESGAVGTKM